MHHLHGLMASWEALCMLYFSSSFDDAGFICVCSFSQQSVSGVTRVPSDMFQGSGQKFTTFGELVDITRQNNLIMGSRF